MQQGNKRLFFKLFFQWFPSIFSALFLFVALIDKLSEGIRAELSMAFMLPMALLTIGFIVLLFTCLIMTIISLASRNWELFKRNSINLFVLILVWCVVLIINPTTMSMVMSV